MQMRDIARHFRGEHQGLAKSADAVARRIATHPEARLQLVGYLSEPRDKDRHAALPRLGSVEEISRVASERNHAARAPR